MPEGYIYFHFRLWDLTCLTYPGFSFWSLRTLRYFAVTVALGHIGLVFHGQTDRWDITNAWFTEF